MDVTQLRQRTAFESVASVHCVLGVDCELKHLVQNSMMSAR